MKRTALGIAFLGVLGAGCATGPQLVNAWRDPNFAGPAFKKVAVVGIAQRDSGRRIFESAFASTLQEQGVEAVASFEVLPKDEKLPREKVEELVKTLGVEAIIVTRIVDRKQESQYVPGATVYPYPSYYGSYYGYYDYAWGAYHDPGYVYNYEVVSLESNVYETVNYNLVWSGTSETVDPQDVESESRTLAKAIISELIANKMLAPSRR